MVCITNLFVSNARTDDLHNEVGQRRTVRATQMKKQAYQEYGTAPGKGVCAIKPRTTKSGSQAKDGCEVDHLISQELGRAEAVDNLWPQPYIQHPGAHEKDWLENELHKEVCKGTITLEDARQEIRDDWYAAYLKRRP